MKVFWFVSLAVFIHTEVRADEPVRLSVLSYNIHHAEGVDRKLDLERIARVIKSVKPDLVALQEVDKKTSRVNGSDQPAELAKQTGMHVRFEKNIAFAGGQYGNATLSRFPIKSHRNIHLPNIDNGEQRGVLICEIEIPGLRSSLLFLNTHLDHRPASEERIASAQRINELISKSADAPALLAGDMNDTLQGPAVGKLLEVWTNPGEKEHPTVPVAKPKRQIDFIFHRPARMWTVVEVKVLDESVASDHRAILTVLELR